MHGRRIMAKLSVRQIIYEWNWMAPELKENEEWLQEWCRKKWGVHMDEILDIPEEEEEEL